MCTQAVTYNDDATAESVIGEECCYAGFDFEGNQHHVYRFFCGDTVVGGVYKGDESTIKIEVSDGEFEAKDPSYELLAKELQDVFAKDEEDPEEDE